MSDEPRRLHPSDIVSRLQDRARCHEKLLRSGDNAEPWPELFRDAAITIAELRKEVERLRGENERYESFALRVAAFMALDTATASCWNAYNTKMDDREREARAALQGEMK